METSLLEYFVFNDQLSDTCDFKPHLLEEGPGIYEVFKVENGIPLFLEDHIDRFYESALIDNYNLGFSRKVLLQRLKSLIESNKLKNGNVRFQYVNHPELGYFIMAWVAFRPHPSKNDIENGIQLKSFQGNRTTPHSKRVNLPLWQAAEKIISADIAEVLLVTENGLVTEGSRSNIFFVKGEKLFTPPNSLVLKGITREKIIELAKTNNISFNEKNLHLNELGDYDACFLSSTSKSVLHIKKIDGFEFSVPHALIRKIELLYDNLAKQYLSDFAWKP